jgi:hypothetical protein
MRIRRKMRKTFHWFLVLGLVAGLLAALLPTAGVQGATLGWSTTSLPSATGIEVFDGAKGLVMAASPNYANDSSLWMSSDSDGDGTDELYRSTNGGVSWAFVDIDGAAVTNNIVAIVPSPFFSSDATVFVATTTTVFRSTNGGISFSQLGADQGSVNGNEEITSMDVSPNYNGVGEIAVGLADPDPGVDDCPNGPGNDGLDDCVRVWGRANVLNWVSPASADSSGDDGALAGDVTAIKYSPAFSGDGVLMVVASAATATGALASTGTFLIHIVGTSSFWGAVFPNIEITTEVEDIGDLTNGILTSAIALPSDYDGSDSATRMVFVALNSDDNYSPDDDGIYRITTSASVVVPNGDGGIAGYSTIAYSGTRTAGTLLTTSADTGNANVVFRSTSAFGSTGVTYSARRPIPGDDSEAGTNGAVLYEPGGTAFALIDSASGRDGGFSRSTSDGLNWAQISHMRNTGLTTSGSIAGFAVSPDFDSSQHIVMASADANSSENAGEDAIWRSTNAGSLWERTESVVLTGTSEAVVFAYSPAFATDNTIYYGEVGGNTLKRTTNGGETWSTRSLVACGSQNIASLIATDANTVILGCDSGLVQRSINGGFLFSNATGTPGTSVDSIAVAPDDPAQFLVGGDGDVRLSTNTAQSFARLGRSGPGTGQTQVAFHPDYASNNMVYAGSDTSGDGVFRWTVGTSSSWGTGRLNTDDTNEVVAGLAFGSDGTLYVTDSATFDLTDASQNGGVWSSVNATATTISFEQLQVTGSSQTGSSNHADDSDVTTGIAVATVSSNRIWVIENTGTDRLRHYTDTVGTAVTPTALTPADATIVGSSNSDGDGIIGFSLSWDAVSGANSYRVNWAVASTFSGGGTSTVSSSTTSIAEGSLPDGDGSGADAAGDRIPGQTYYWRVRVETPVIGAYSAAQTVNMALLAGTTAGTPTLVQPNSANFVAALSSAVDLRPLFVWTQVNNATGYELQVSTDGTFIDVSQIVINRTGSSAVGNTLAFRAATVLQPGTVYFWRVRGISSTSQGAYPPAAAFTTSTTSVGGSIAADTALAPLTATGNLELVVGFNYTTALFEAFVPGLAGNVLATIQPNSVIFVTVSQSMTIVVSGISFSIQANTPTPIPVGASVTITVQ